VGCKCKCYYTESASSISKGNKCEAKSIFIHVCSVKYVYVLCAGLMEYSFVNLRAKITLPLFNNFMQIEPESCMTQSYQISKLRDNWRSITSPRGRDILPMAFAPACLSLSFDFQAFDTQNNTANFTINVCTKL
jgi:hypothetical protein